MMVCERAHSRPEQGAPVTTRDASHSLDRLDNQAWLTTTAWWPTHPGCCCRPGALAQHLGLQQLVDAHLDLGKLPRKRANVGDKSVDPDRLRARGLIDVHRRRSMRCASGGTARRPRLTPWKAPSTLGHVSAPASAWGHVRQLDRVTRRVARPGLGVPERDPAQRHSPSTSTRRSHPVDGPMRLAMDWVSASSTTATPACSATTRCSTGSMRPGAVTCARVQAARRPVPTLRPSARTSSPSCFRQSAQSSRAAVVRADN